MKTLVFMRGFAVFPIITHSSTRRTIPVAYIYIYLLILQITLLLFERSGALYAAFLDFSPLPKYNAVSKAFIARYEGRYVWKLEGFNWTGICKFLKHTCEISIS